MPNKNEENLKILLSKIFASQTDEHTQAMMTSLKAEFENLPVDVSFVSQRVKAPISVLKKFNSDPQKYGTDWARMKDVVGLMVVVDKNSDVDKVIDYIEKTYSQQKNPYSRNLYHDYRKDDFRRDKGFVESHEPVPSEYDPPTDKGYQKSDGFKNVRANIVVGGYPVEIQIKTKEQYIAHEATHDRLYKSAVFKSEAEKTAYSAKIFPYFEAYAHLHFHEDRMSEAEKTIVKNDINEIYLRNVDYFNKYPQVFNEACKVFAIYMFVFNNRREIFANATLTNAILNSKLIEAEVERVFNYTEQKLSIASTSKDQDPFLMAISAVSNMDFKQFSTIKSQIAGLDRLDTCILSAGWEMLRQRDVELIKSFGESYEKVYLGVYDDKLFSAVTAKSPMYTLDQRLETLKHLKNVQGVATIGMNAKLQPEPTLTLESESSESEPKPYKIGYLSGVFDMLHPEHVEYIKSTSKLCDKLVVGTVSDLLSVNARHKMPIISEDERCFLLGQIKEVGETVKTQNEILPPLKVLDEMQNEAQNGNNCAIFLDPRLLSNKEDFLPFEQKELSILQNEYPEITLVELPGKEASAQAALGFRQQGTDRIGDINSCEVSLLENQE